MRRSQFKFGAVAALLWIFAAVAGYCVAHKPYMALNLLAVGRAGAGLLDATLVVGLSIGPGRQLLGHIPGVTGLEVIVLSAGVGWGAMAVLALALGSPGWLRPWVLWALTLAGLFVCRESLGKAIFVALEDLAWRLRSRFEQVLAGYRGSMLVTALLWALTPPTAWDSLVYHLTGPKLYLATGRVSHSLDLPHLGFPQLAEMLFAWGMDWQGSCRRVPSSSFCGSRAVTTVRRTVSPTCCWIVSCIPCTSTVTKPTPSPPPGTRRGHPCVAPLRRLGEHLGSPIHPCHSGGSAGAG